MIEKQKTIKNSITISGKGLHSGDDVKITFYRPLLIMDINLKGSISKDIQ